MSADPSDETLAAAWQAGDQAAANELLRRYVAPLHRYFQTKVGSADADDLRQDALIRIASAIAGFRFDSSFRTYMYRVAYRTLCDRLRYQSSGRGRRDATTCSLEELHGSIAGAESLAPDLHDLVAALRMLSVEDQMLFELRHVEGLSYREVASVLDTGCAVPTLRARIHGIKQRLRVQLGDNDERQRHIESIIEPPASVAVLGLAQRLLRLRRYLESLLSAPHCVDLR